MHGIIFESTNGLSCSKAGTTEGLSYFEPHDYSATCGTVSGAQLGASVRCSLEDRYEMTRSFLRGTLYGRRRIEGAASNIFREDRNYAPSTDDDSRRSRRHKRTAQSFF